jgi:hypothetical protein
MTTNVDRPTGGFALCIQHLRGFYLRDEGVFFHHWTRLPIGMGNSYRPQKARANPGLKWGVNRRGYGTGKQMSSATLFRQPRYITSFGIQIRSIPFEFG